MIFPLPLSQRNIQQAIETHTIFDDPKVIPHLASMLGLVKNDDLSNLDLVELSNIIKQTKPNHDAKVAQNKAKLEFHVRVQQPHKKVNCVVRNFVKQAQKLQIAGISLGQSTHQLIQKEVNKIAQEKGLVQCRFWGKILGSFKDYYVIQGYRPAPKQHATITLGSQKTGEGVNYYTYFVTNDLKNGRWEQLPSINIEHVKIARKIKKIFTGVLNTPIISYPAFPGVERHYLKAQLARITHSLQLAPKGIYKPNDQNPKVIEYEDEVKIPDFSELSTPQGWVHQNQMILNLGRCSHFVDPSLPQDQLEAAASELAEKDPEVQRLRGITQDKLPQPVEGGPQTFWIQKTVGNNQTFPKDETTNIYAVTTLKNTLWPGWITIGYMGGYSNFYLGTGHKANQPAWSTVANENLQQQGDDVKQFPEPNPKQLPPPPAQVPAEGQENQEEQ